MDAERLEQELAKLLSKLSSSFTDEMKKAGNPEIQNKIVEVSKVLEDTLQTKSEDAKLNEIKEQKKALEGGYNDVIKECRNKIKFLILTLKERGVK